MYNKMLSKSELIELLITNLESDHDEMHILRLVWDLSSPSLKERFLSEIN